MQVANLTTIVNMGTLASMSSSLMDATRKCMKMITESSHFASLAKELPSIFVNLKDLYTRSKLQGIFKQTPTVPKSEGQSLTLSFCLLDSYIHIKTVQLAVVVTAHYNVIGMQCLICWAVC